MRPVHIGGGARGPSSPFLHSQSFLSQFYLPPVLLTLSFGFRVQRGVPASAVWSVPPSAARSLSSPISPPTPPVLSSPWKAVDCRHASQYSRLLCPYSSAPLAPPILGPLWAQECPNMCAPDDGLDPQASCKGMMAAREFELKPEVEVL